MDDVYLGLDFDHSSLDRALVSAEQVSRRAHELLLHDRTTADFEPLHLRLLDGIIEFTREHASRLPAGAAPPAATEIQRAIAESRGAASLRPEGPVDASLVAARLAVLTADGVRGTLKPVDVALCNVSIRSATGETPQPVAREVTRILALITDIEAAAMADAADLAHNVSRVTMVADEIPTESPVLRKVSRMHAALNAIVRCSQQIGAVQLQRLQAVDPNRDGAVAELESLAADLDPEWSATQ